MFCGVPLAFAGGAVEGLSSFGCYNYYSCPDTTLRINFIKLEV